MPTQPVQPPKSTTALDSTPPVIAEAKRMSKRLRWISILASATAAVVLATWGIFAYLDRFQTKDEVKETIRSEIVGHNVNHVRAEDIKAEIEKAEKVHAGINTTLNDLARTLTAVKTKQEEMDKQQDRMDNKIDAILEKLRK